MIGKYYQLNYTERSVELLSRDGRIAVASSLITAAVMSLLFFTIGFLCRHFCRKERKMAGTVSSPVGQTQIPYYDNVVLKQELELKANVAYGPVR